MHRIKELVPSSDIGNDLIGVFSPDQVGMGGGIGNEVVDGLLPGGG